MDYFPGFCHKAYDYDARCLTYHLHKYPHIFQHISGKLSVEVIFMDNKKNDTESKDEGVQMAKNGEIKGVGVAHRRDTEYLKSIPDDSENNNLGSLPTVSG